MDVRGRVIRAGRARGPVLYSEEPVGFFGCVDPRTGEITDRTHPLRGRSVAGAILVFPRGKGSTVGSYTLYACARNGCAPAGMVLAECGAIIAAGAAMGQIPTVDRIDVTALASCRTATIDGEVVCCE